MPMTVEEFLNTDVPDGKASELEEKLTDYAIAGVPLIWVIDPKRRTVRIMNATRPARWLTETDALDGDDVIPGFTCRVEEIFAGIAR